MKIEPNMHVNNFVIATDEELSDRITYISISSKQLTPETIFFLNHYKITRIIDSHYKK